MGKSKGGRAKVKVQQKMPKGAESDKMMGMFNQMLGTERPDYTVVKPKCDELLKCLEKVKNLLYKFGNSPISKSFPNLEIF